MRLSRRAIKRRFTRLFFFFTNVPRLHTRTVLVEFISIFLNLYTYICLNMCWNMHTYMCGTTHGERNAVHVSAILIWHVFYANITKAVVCTILFRVWFKHANANFSIRCLCMPKNTFIVPIILLIIYSHSLLYYFHLLSRMYVVLVPRICT